jgi:reactive intermediate/imine deaminase
MTVSNHVRRGALALLAMVLTACAGTRPAEYLTTTVGPPRPFSPAVRVNGFLYLSGQIGTDSTGAVVPGGIQAETRQTMENIGAVLRRSGSSFDRVVKCTVFIADMKEWGAMNEVYVTYFAADKRPARSALGANGLALDAKVEIECIAH